MKKIIIFLLLILSISIFSQEKKEYDPYLIKNGEKLLSYNDDTEEDDEEYDMEGYDSEEEDPYYTLHHLLLCHHYKKVAFLHLLLNTGHILFSLD